MLWMFGGYDQDGSGTASAPTYTRPCSQVGQHYLRRTLQELYKPGLEMFPGDEDNGQMSAWLLLSSLGLYSINPGSAHYALGSPLFEDVTIQIATSPTPVMLHITAVNQGPDNVYVHQIQLNGKVLVEGQIKYKDLVRGGELRFTMSNVPMPVPAGASSA
jgi:putative alpha-1,2-mannosidase